MDKIFILLFSAILLSVISCNIPTEDDFREELSGALFAIPILDDEIQIQDLFSSDSEEVQIYSDSEGRVTVSYEGEVLRDPASVVFPPIYGILDIPFTDTIFELDLSMGSVTQNEVDSAVFLKDKLRFKFASSSTEPITVRAWVDEISKNGEVLSQTVTFPGSPDGSLVEMIGPDIDMEDWILKGSDNKITLHYDARTASNERIKIDQVFVNFNVLEFKYIQGYFPKTIRPVVGSFIPINLYKNWIGGTMNFTEPRVALEVENSFGFAVGADFKKMTIETISGENLDIESNIIDEGIIFEYPTIDEVGQVKSTDFYFDNTNSNIAVLFQDRVAKFNYEIDAVANPLGLNEFLGFMTNESFYAVQLKVEVPLHMSINNLQLVDTFDVNFDIENEYVDSIELKLIVENRFPIDVSTQFYMLDKDNQVVDSIFHQGEILLEGGTYLTGGVLGDTEPQTFFVNFSENKISNLLRTKRILAKPTFLSTPNGEDHIWIYEDYGLKIKMGAKFSLQL